MSEAYAMKEARKPHEFNHGSPDNHPPVLSLSLFFFNIVYAEAGTKWSADLGDYGEQCAA